MTQIFDLRQTQQRKVEHLFRHKGTQSGDNNGLAFCYKTLIIRLHFQYYKTHAQRFKVLYIMFLLRMLLGTSIH